MHYNGVESHMTAISTLTIPLIAEVLTGGKSMPRSSE